MISELFLYDRDKGLFKAILQESDVIAGRYHVSPSYGHDLNANNLDSFLKDPAFGLTDVKQKYPICVCMTPKSRMVRINGQKWEEFIFILYFLCRANTDGNNQIKKLDRSTNTSGQHVWYDWDDMKQCAVDFIEVLHQLIRKKMLNDTTTLKSILQIEEDRMVLTRLSRFNNDKLNGVCLSFPALMYSDACTVKDYSIGVIKNIDIPSGLDDVGDGGGGAGAGDTPINFTDFTYDQDTGDLTFTGGNTIGLTQLNVTADDGGVLIEGGALSFGNVNYGENVFPEFGSFLSVRTVIVNWRRRLSGDTYTAWSQKQLVITRLAYRRIKLYALGIDMLITEENLPILPVNVNGVQLAQAATMNDYIAIWNADPDNAAIGQIMSFTRFPSSMAQPPQYYRFRINFADNLLTVPFTRFEATIV